MAFPTVESVTATAFPTNDTQHLVNMPAAVDAGDLLIVLFANDGSDTVTTPSGWTLLDSSANGTAVRLSCYAKDAVGDEDGTTVDFVTSGNEYAAAQCYRITGWSGDVNDVENSTAATGSDDSPNPASLTASWGSDDNLWIAACCSDSNVTVSVYPFANNNTNTIADQVTHGVGLGSCSENNATATNDAGSFTISGAQEWVATTLVVKPFLYTELFPVGYKRVRNVYLRR
jgi:hypothetical protein